MRGIPRWALKPKTGGSEGKRELPFPIALRPLRGFFAEIQNRERVATHLNLVCACVVCGPCSQSRVPFPVSASTWFQFGLCLLPPSWPLSAGQVIGVPALISSPQKTQRLPIRPRESDCSEYRYLMPSAKNPLIGGKNYFTIRSPADRQTGRGREGKTSNHFERQHTPAISN